MLAAQIPIVQWGSICTTGWEGEEGGGETMEFKMAAGGAVPPPLQYPPPPTMNKNWAALDTDYWTQADMVHRYTLYTQPHYSFIVVFLKTKIKYFYVLQACVLQISNIGTKDC